MLLERRLHVDVVGRRYVVRGHEYAPYMLRHLGDVVERALPCDSTHQSVRIEALALCNLRKIRVYLRKLVIVHNVPDKRERKQRLNAA